MVSGCLWCPHVFFQFSPRWGALRGIIHLCRTNHSEPILVYLSISLPYLRGVGRGPISRLIIAAFEGVYSVLYSCQFEFPLYLNVMLLGSFYYLLGPLGSNDFHMKKMVKTPKIAVTVRTQVRMSGRCHS